MCLLENVWPDRRTDEWGHKYSTRTHELFYMHVCVMCMHTCTYVGNIEKLLEIFRICCYCCYTSGVLCMFMDVLAYTFERTKRAREIMCCHRFSCFNFLNTIYNIESHCKSVRDFITWMQFAQIVLFVQYRYTYSANTLTHTYT